MAIRNFGAVQFRAMSRITCVHRPAATTAVARAAAAVTGRREMASGNMSDVTTKFGDPSFWEGKYSSQYASPEKLEPFEWFLPYEGGLQQHLVPYLESLPSCNRLLHVGCGTSEVGPKLTKETNLDVHVTDADSSPSAVRIMKRRHAGLEKYTCHQSDVLSLSFSDGSFDAVVDKGTLDALLCRGVDDAQAMAVEMHRVLSKDGVFLQITTEQPEARLDLLTRSSEGKHAPWSRSLFKEIGEGSGSSYFMYILVK